MNQLSNLVYPVITQALSLKEKLDAGEAVDVPAEKVNLLKLIRGDGRAVGSTEYFGDGEFLGARYALACWVDELFILHCNPTSINPPVPNQWQKTKILEDEIFGTARAAQKFWEQLDIVLGHPNVAAKARITPGSDVVETFFLCVILGFRGTHFENPAKVREYVDEMRPRVTRTTPWSTPRELGVKTNVEPLLGRAVLRRVVVIYGSAALLTGFVLLLLWRTLQG
jgi:type VI secretion system protein ImpK